MRRLADPAGFRRLKAVIKPRSISCGAEISAQGNFISPRRRQRAQMVGRIVNN